MTTIRNAALLAAGLGQRMRPLTETTPKPLLTLGGRALMDYALDRLAEAGIEQVVVNAHWQADRIADHLSARTGAPRTILRREPDLLDTGGAVAASLREGLFGDGAFFVANSDSVCSTARSRRCAGWRRSWRIPRTVRCMALFSCTARSRCTATSATAIFFVDKMGLPRRRLEREIAPYVYAGITLATGALFANLRGHAFFHEHGVGCGDRRRHAAGAGA